MLFSDEYLYFYAFLSKIERNQRFFYLSSYPFRSLKWFSIQKSREIETPSDAANICRIWEDFLGLGQS